LLATSVQVLLAVDSAARNVDPATGSAITHPVLALVGGFSASLLYRLMDRLSRSIESMVSGPPGAGPSWMPPLPGEPALAPPQSGPSPSTDELIIALSRLTTALEQGQVQLDNVEIGGEPSQKQLTAAVIAATDADGSQRVK
jgi:hypothetical protein